MANIVYCQLWGWTFGSLPAGKFPRHEARRVCQWDRHRHHRQYAQDFETSTVSQSRALKHPLANCGNQWKQHQGANLTGTGVPGFMGVTFPDTIYIYTILVWVRNCFLHFFPVLDFFFASSVLSVFLVICSSLELEAAISTVLQHFGVRTSHFPFHVGWYFAARVHLGFV